MPGLVNYIRVYRRCRRRIIIFAVHGAGVQCARTATELDRPHTTKAPATDLTRMALYKTIWRCQSPFILSLSLTPFVCHTKMTIFLFSSVLLSALHLALKLETQRGRCFFPVFVLQLKRGMNFSFNRSISNSLQFSLLLDAVALHPIHA